MEEKPIILLLMSLKAFNAEKSWLRHLFNVQSVASMVFVRFLLNAYWCNTAMHIDKVVAGDSIYYYFSSWVCSASGCDVDNDGSRRHSTWALAHSLSLSVTHPMSFEAFLLQWHLFAPLFIITAFDIIADASQIPFKTNILCFNAMGLFQVDGQIDYNVQWSKRHSPCINTNRVGVEWNNVHTF